MRTLADEKKGITVKIDAGLHAQVKEYIEQHGITMAEFVTMALDNELHPKFEQKEKNNMGKMRTVAFQVPEELFNRVKDYLHRNNISQKDFVLGLIEDELDREQAERENLDGNEQPYDEDEAAEDFEPDEVTEDAGGLEEDIDRNEEQYEPEDEYEGESEEADEDESEDEDLGFSMGM